jgi:electron transfer flavoprotein beta subunit
MNIFVLMKQVPDTETKIRIKGGGTGIETGDIKWVINPYDEFAIEEAIKTKDKIKAGAITVVSVGPDRVVESLRTALAMGCDNAVHVKTDADFSDGFIAAQALAAVCKKQNAELIFTGKQAIDDDQCTVFGYVGEMLDWPSSSVVVKCDIDVASKKAKVEREVEGGTRHTIEMSVPCVIAVNKGINTPRYASLPGIMKAKKKEIQAFSLGDLGITTTKSNVSVGDYQLPPERKAGKKIEGDVATQAKELVRLLHEEAKVL